MATQERQGSLVVGDTTRHRKLFPDKKMLFAKIVQRQNLENR